MENSIYRSISEPIRDHLIWDEMWLGPDKGIIRCWENGRQLRVREPDLATRAENGELPILDWKGGVDAKLNIKLKQGSLNYLATWQGLCGMDLRIEFDDIQELTCSKTGQIVQFAALIVHAD